MLEIRYVWQWPVRICHWVNVLCMIMLSITGFYIGSPFMTAPDSSQYIMGWMRFLHFSFAYLFTVSVLSRILWMFIGNHHASWRAFFPWTSKQGRANFVNCYYNNLLRYWRKHHPQSYPLIWVPVNLGRMIRLLRSWEQ